MDMRLIYLIINLFVLVTITNAQSVSELPVQTLSPDSSIAFRLFSTRNMYTYIKLNTRNGKMWQIQWGTSSKYRMENLLSDVSRVNASEERNGRFFLVPTTNIYTLLLIDQIDGRVWQVQWSNEPSERLVVPIY